MNSSPHLYTGLVFVCPKERSLTMLKTLCSLEKKRLRSESNIPGTLGHRQSSVTKVVYLSQIISYFGFSPFISTLYLLYDHFRDRFRNLS